MSNQGDLSFKMNHQIPLSVKHMHMNHRQMLVSSPSMVTNRDVLRRDKESPSPLQLFILLVPDRRCSAHRTDTTLQQCWFADGGLHQGPLVMGMKPK